MMLKPSKRPFMIPAKPIVFIESNLEHKIPYLAAVGDSDKLKRQDQPSPGQYIYKMSGSKRSRENYFMKVLQKLHNQEEWRSHFFEKIFSPADADDKM